PARSNCQASKRPSKPAPAIAMEALGESRLGCAELGNGVTSRAKTEGPGRQMPGLVPSAGVNLIRFYGFGRTDLSLRTAVKPLPRRPDKRGQYTWSGVGIATSAKVKMPL